MATLALLLVLFTDAIAVDSGEVRLQKKLAGVILGPGTLIPAVLISVAAWLLLASRRPAPRSWAPPSPRPTLSSSAPSSVIPGCHRRRAWRSGWRAG